jgi:predicted  nucleic acid-binding Zn-ribbon protein
MDSIEQTYALVEIVVISVVVAMWSNFRDVRSLAEKISHVVAPPVDDDHEEEEDGADEEEYSEGEYSTEEEDTPGPSPFGFVGMLTRAMDQNDHRRQEDESENQQRYGKDTLGIQEFDNDDVEDEVDFQTPEEMFNSEYEPNLVFSVADQDQMPHEASPVGATCAGDIVQSAAFVKPTEYVSATTSDVALSPPVRRRVHLPRDDSMDDSTPIIPPALVTYPSAPPSSYRSPNDSETAPPALVTYASAPEEPFRLSLVRESGSVSPQRTNGKPRVGGRRELLLEHALSNETPLSSRSLGSTPSGTEVVLSPLRDILLAAEPPDSSAVPTLPRDALLGSFSVALQEETKECADEQADENHRPGLPHEEDGLVRPPARVDSDVVPQITAPRPLPGLGLPSMVEDDEDGSSEPAVEDAVMAASNDDPRLAETRHWQKRCHELQEKLENAEQHIIELQQQAASIVEQDTSDLQKLIQHFTEKEARLLQASNEEHNQEMLALRREMLTETSLLQHQLFDERKVFQQEREQLESMLVDFRGKVVQVESHVRAEQEKSEKTVEQMQQQHLRALRKVEDKLAHAMALIDERDDDANRLKETIKKLESKVAEHHEGADEAEEELNELHHENETLHDQVERLESECAELRSKISKLEGDSEKLVHLKVCEE